MGPIEADEGPEAFQVIPKRAAADQGRPGWGPGSPGEAALDEERDPQTHKALALLVRGGYVPGGDKRLDGTPQVETRS